MISEQIVVLGPARSLAGVLTTAETRGASDLAVVLLNAGMIHRVGPARLYVHVARALAKQGYDVLRFDLSSLGDSVPRPDNLPLLEAIVRDPQDVMDDLGRMGYTRFVLMGICSGAYCAFKTACHDARVVGAALINPQDFVGDSNWISHAWAERYWNKSLFSARAWMNLLSGRVDYQRLVNVLSKQLINKVHGRGEHAATVTRALRGEIDALINRNVQVLLLFSSADVSMEQFRLLFGRDIDTERNRGSISQVVVPGADHLFGRTADQARMIDEVSTWLARFGEAAPRSATAVRYVDPVGSS